MKYMEDPGPPRLMKPVGNYPAFTLTDPALWPGDGMASESHFSRRQRFY